MLLADLPIPDAPTNFSPMGAPPGVAINYSALKGADGRSPWYLSRPVITPTTQVVHTNAAQQEGTLQSAINWGNAAANNTKPHYAVNWPQPTKLVPTDRRAIANSSGSDVEKAAGVQDCSFWSIAIETADAGTLNGIGGFLTESRYGRLEVPHGEIVARIFAYESIVWDIPLIVPELWTDPGTITHTWPFPYPHFTTVRGKTCPGATKIAEFRTEVLARARQIAAAWTAPPPPPPILEDDVKPYLWRPAGYINIFLIDGARAIHADGVMVARAQAEGIELVDSDAHEQLLRSVLHQCGLTTFDLIARP